MNKTEKLIVVILAAAAAGLFWYRTKSGAERARAEAERAAVAAAQAAQQTEQSAKAPAGGNSADAARASADAAAAAPRQSAAPAQAAGGDVPAVPSVPLAEDAVISNGFLSLSLSSRGACAVKAVLHGYSEKPGSPGPDNPPVALDFSAYPALVLRNVPGLDPYAAYTLKEQTSNSVLFASADGKTERRITLDSTYGVVLEERFAGCTNVQNSISAGILHRTGAADEILAFDSRPRGGDTIHWNSDKAETASAAELKRALGGVSGSGCGCGCSSAAPDPSARTVPIPGAIDWMAMKSRFFMAAVYAQPSGDGNAAAPAADGGFMPRVEHSAAGGANVASAISADVIFSSLPESRKTTFYFGPRKQSDLWDRGMRDAMDFGWCRWICYPLVWLLNTLDSVFGNYGVAVIILTILVRLLFWPLTHKTTISMRKMQEIQPLVKEIQARCKDNPQKLQMETMALYREHGVNPLASCLPMLVQIPFFIALFYVLRSGVELRYAPFLWIDDLSAPEHLLPGIFPFGGLNILPILMAVTMFLQSKFSPSAGGAQAAQQQKMMMYMMPAMMLVMFYNFASALSLYWTLSQVMSIAQTLYIRKKYAPAPVDASKATVDAPMTRQRRRHGG